MYSKYIPCTIPSEFHHVMHIISTHKQYYSCSSILISLLNHSGLQRWSGQHHQPLMTKKSMQHLEVCESSIQATSLHCLLNYSPKDHEEESPYSTIPQPYDQGRTLLGQAVHDKSLAQNDSGCHEPRTAHS